jgi:hypothetical protein
MSTESIEALVSTYTKIKEDHADIRLNFYKSRADNRKRAAYATSFIIIIVSFIVIPIVTNFVPENAAGISNKAIISGASILLALVSVVQEKFKWELLWNQYSTRIVQIESAIGRWELEVADSRILSDEKEANEKLKEATNRLLSVVDELVLSEMKIFFGTVKEEKDQTAT